MCWFSRHDRYLEDESAKAGDALSAWVSAQTKNAECVLCLGSQRSKREWTVLSMWHSEVAYSLAIETLPIQSAASHADLDRWPKEFEIYAGVGMDARPVGPRWRLVGQSDTNWAPTENSTDPDEQREILRSRALTGAVITHPLLPTGQHTMFGVSPERTQRTEASLIRQADLASEWDSCLLFLIGRDSEGLHHVVQLFTGLDEMNVLTTGTAFSRLAAEIPDEWRTRQQAGVLFRPTVGAEFLASLPPI